MNNKLIMNNFHIIWFQNFRQFSNLFSQIRLESDKRHFFLEFVAKSGQNVIKNSQKKCKIRLKKWKIGNSLFIREKMLTIFGGNFEIWAVQKYVNLVDLVKSFPTSIDLQKSASLQPRPSLSKFGGKFNSLFIRLLSSGTAGRSAHELTCRHNLKI